MGSVELSFLDDKMAVLSLLIPKPETSVKMSSIGKVSRRAWKEGEEMARSSAAARGVMLGVVSRVER